jgi:hypothetical protein
MLTTVTAVTTTLVAALLLVPASRALAQANRSATASGLPAWAWDHCLSGVTYGQPFKLAVSYAAGMLHESMTGGADVCIFGAAKVGFGAARGSIGIGRSTGPLGTGVALNAGVMRTFGSAWGATPSRTYIGGGINVWPVLGLGGEIGYYVRIGDRSGEPNRQRRIITWSAGFGF